MTSDKRRKKGQLSPEDREIWAKVTKTLTRPGYTCELVLYETRPGFFASGSIWTPTALKKSGGKAPGDQPWSGLR